MDQGDFPPVDNAHLLSLEAIAHFHTLVIDLDCAQSDTLSSGVLISRHKHRPPDSKRKNLGMLSEPTMLDKCEKWLAVC